MERDTDCLEEKLDSIVVPAGPDSLPRGAYAMVSDVRSSVRLEMMK